MKKQKRSVIPAKAGIEQDPRFREDDSVPTPFQQKVYAVVRRIPKGQVRTYIQIARAIGNPKAARAVGQALKRNRWAPQIPCHRVVASDGSLGGYSAGGGIPRKKQLLHREDAIIPSWSCAKKFATGSRKPKRI